jgi:hypothetical protein
MLLLSTTIGRSGSGTSSSAQPLGRRVVSVAAISFPCRRRLVRAAKVLVVALAAATAAFVPAAPVMAAAAAKVVTLDFEGVGLHQEIGSFYGSGGGGGRYATELVRHSCYADLELRPH